MKNQFEKAMEENLKVANDARLGEEPARKGHSTWVQQLQEDADNHRETYRKLQAAADFLQAHPDFDEFLRLIRVGAIVP